MDNHKDDDSRTDAELNGETWPHDAEEAAGFEYEIMHPYEREQPNN